MRNYEKYNFKTITTENFTAFCNVYNNRSGFVHECRLELKTPQPLKNGSFLIATHGKSQYYNRTWESYEFESVINKAIRNLPKNLQEQAQKEFEEEAKKESAKWDSMFNAFQQNFNSLKDSQRESIRKHVDHVETPAQFEAVGAIVGMMAAINKLSE